MVIKNPNNIFVPDYLNEEFFVAALEEGLRELQLAVNEVTFEWGSNPGDNYCSHIYRVLVAYERLVEEDEQLVQEQRSLIVKIIPISEGTRFLEDIGVFLKEKLTYLDVLPRLQILVDGPKFSATLVCSLLNKYIYKRYTQISRKWVFWKVLRFFRIF